jgi:hypothetical protein
LCSLLIALIDNLALFLVDDEAERALLTAPARLLGLFAAELSPLAEFLAI